MENNEMMEYDTVILELDDDTEACFAIIDSFMIEDKSYVLLSMIKDDEVSIDADDMVFMLDETPEDAEEDEILLTAIESDEEYDAVEGFYIEKINQEA